MTVRLADLTTEQRALVLALIAAAKSANGHNLCTRVAIEIDRYGTVTPALRSEFAAWVTSQA